MKKVAPALLVFGMIAMVVMASGCLDGDPQEVPDEDPGDGFEDPNEGLDDTEDTEDSEEQFEDPEEEFGGEDPIE